MPSVHDYDLLPEALIELCQAVKSLPRRYRKKFSPICEQLASSLGTTHRLIEVAQEVIDQQQLDIKYLEFDLEATYRERDNFRAQLEHD